MRFLFVLLVCLYQSVVAHEILYGGWKPIESAPDRWPMYGQPFRSGLNEDDMQTSESNTVSLYEPSVQLPSAQDIPIAGQLNSFSDNIVTRPIKQVVTISPELKKRMQDHKMTGTINVVKSIKFPKKVIKVQDQRMYNNQAEDAQQLSDLYGIQLSENEQVYQGEKQHEQYQEEPIDVKQYEDHKTNELAGLSYPPFHLPPELFPLVYSAPCKYNKQDKEQDVKVITKKKIKGTKMKLHELHPDIVDHMKKDKDFDKLEVIHSGPEMLDPVVIAGQVLKLVDSLIPSIRIRVPVVDWLHKLFYEKSKSEVVYVKQKPKTKVNYVGVPYKVEEPKTEVKVVDDNPEVKVFRITDDDSRPNGEEETDYDKPSEDEEEREESDDSPEDESDDEYSGQTSNKKYKVVAKDELRQSASSQSKRWVRRPKKSRKMSFRRRMLAEAIQLFSLIK